MDTEIRVVDGKEYKMVKRPDQTWEEVEQSFRDRQAEKAADNSPGRINSLPKKIKELEDMIVSLEARVQTLEGGG